MELEIVICEAMKLPKEQLEKLASIVEAELFILSMEEAGYV